MTSVKIQWYPGEMAEQLFERAELPHGVDDAYRDKILRLRVEEDLKEYYYMLRRATPQFSLQEAYLLFDALNGTITQKEVAHALFLGIKYSIEVDHLDEKHGINGQALIERLERMGQENPFGCWALAEAIRLAWNAPTYTIINTEERLRAVGIVRPDRPQVERA